MFLRRFFIMQLTKYAEDPQVLGVNKLPPHADRNYQDCISLNGMWKFGSFYDWELLNNFYKVELTNSLEVPFHPELAGFDIPIYTNIQYPFNTNPPYVPHENNPLSIYEREFDIPESWIGKKIIISFQGADSFLNVAVNGNYVGSSKGSRNPAEFDITNVVKPGKNIICAATLRWSDATYIEDQDMWWLSGLFRDVYIFCQGDYFIEDFDVKTSLDEISLSVKTSQVCNIDIELVDVFSCKISSNEKLVKKVKVKSWSAETPNLYTLKITTPDDVIETKIGFRTIDIKDGQLLINNQSVKLFGVNHHDFNSKRGRATTIEDMLFDIKTLKEHNFNAVRNSHYPKQSVWYNLCDEYGLYCIDEADQEAHGMRGALSVDSRWEGAYLDRVQRMYERNKNHPSIIIWSMGNESGYGPNIEACSKYLHNIDSSRPVNYYHAETRDCVDIVGMHYPSLERIQDMLDNEKTNRPILLEEFAHSMGNGTGNMQEYVAMWEAEKRLIGGFIWDWIDQGLEKLGPDGKTFFAYGGDFGDTPNDFQFCHNGIVTPNRKVKPALKDLKHVFRPFVFTFENNQLKVRNRYSFKKLSEFKVFVNNKVIIGECLPKETTTLLANLTAPNLDVKVIDSLGRIVVEEQLGTVKIPDFPNIGQQAVKQDFSYGQLLFDNSGNLIQVGDIKLNISIPEIWRAPTNNDKPFLEMWRSSKIDHVISTQLENIVFENNQVQVEKSSEYFDVKLLYKCCEFGFDLTVDFVPKKTLPKYLPKLGVTIKLPQEFDKFEWYGRGPFECYRDRCSGAKTNLYKANVDDLYNTYLMPQENGNFCDVYMAKVSNLDGATLGCYSKIPFETSLKRYDAITLDKALHEYDLPQSNNVYWSIDWKNAGVGNGSHGPGTLEKYCISPEKTSWTWRFVISK